MTDATAQVDTVIRLLQGKQWDRTGPAFERALGWLSNFPTGVDVKRKKALMKAVCEAFVITEQEVYAAIAEMTLPTLNGHSRALDESALEKSVTTSEWLRNYIEYTRYNEAPMAYHIFAGLCMLGACTGTRITIDKGVFRHYLNYCTILIGPPALAKTICANIVQSFILRTQACPIFPGKITPEAIIDVLMDAGPCQFLYAPEMSAFFGRQKYNIGLVELVNRLLDNPTDHRVKTRAYDVTVPGTVAMTMLCATTPSLLINSMPEQTASSGFLSRFVLVTERSTSRRYWQPIRGPLQLENQICLTLDRLKAMSGTMTYAADADSWGRDWYNSRMDSMHKEEDDVSVEIGSRLAKVHFERTAALLHLADHHDYVVCRQCFETAATLMDYVVHNMPATITAVKASTRMQDAEYIIDQLRRFGGACDHSRLLRACSSRGIDATRFKAHIATLAEAHLLREKRQGSLRFYVIEEEETPTP